MFIQRLLSQNQAPLLEQMVRFAGARHRLLAENIANVDTTGYRQKDLSLQRFQGLLRTQVEQRRRGGTADFDSVGYEVENPMRNILFHDRNNRSMEQLTTDMAKNAMMHNLAVELLRKQYESIQAALRERVV